MTFYPIRVHSSTESSKVGRFDFGVRSGDHVSTFYDPMLGKIIVHANDREEARTKLVGCLEELRLRN